MILEYGLWDQFRTDYGKEWNLMLYINESLSHMRNDPSRPPHLQTSSKQVTVCIIPIVLVEVLCKCLLLHLYVLYPIEPYCRAYVGRSE